MPGRQAWRGAEDRTDAAAAVRSDRTWIKVRKIKRQFPKSTPYPMGIHARPTHSKMCQTHEANNLLLLLAQHMSY